ncbi:MAG: diaminopimelate decarboxylase [Nitrospirales bacterium]|nr:MAG: diaminopimelate decarboxylase [Nitrospirales bacterium]
MPESRDLIARHFHMDSGLLMFGGQTSIETIVATYGTPLFIYDAAVLNRKYELLQQTLPQNFAISYSVKANPSQAILKHFVQKGCGLEIASSGEFLQALQAGCASNAILFAGPGKTKAELELVLAKGIGEIHIESVLEVARIAAISQRLGVMANVAIRVNPTGEALGGAMRMGGQSTPFGIDEEELESVVAQVCSNPVLKFSGLHLFSGTQILDYSVLVSQYRKGLDIARRIVKKTGQPLRTLDFGGGWGIPYFGKEMELDTKKLKSGLEEVFSEVQNDPDFSGTQFMVEPGRYLVGEAGVYVTQITDVKVSRGKKFLIVDGGMHHHLAASGNFGQVIKKNFPVCLVNKIDQPMKETVDVVGPLCTPLDVLARGIQLPEAIVGDLVGVLQSGAYGRTASPLHFLSHCSPPEVLVEGGEAKLIRRRGTYEDLTRDCV